MRRCKMFHGRTVRTGGRCRLLSFNIGILFLLALNACAQKVTPHCAGGMTIEGKVLGPDLKPVGGAVVRLEEGQGRIRVETKSDAAGRFALSAGVGGGARLMATKEGLPDLAAEIPPDGAGCLKEMDLIFSSLAAKAGAGRSDAAPSDAMEFADGPNFSIAGVTDWTAVGGHGSDAALRTSESLAAESASLTPEEGGKPLAEGTVDAGNVEPDEETLRAALVRRPDSADAKLKLGELYLRRGDRATALPLLEGAYKADPTDEESAYEVGLAYASGKSVPQAVERVHALLKGCQSQRLYRLAGELDEKAGDPLGAVEEFQEAAKLDPSEANYFAWGSELLEHRAIWQALEVLQVGVKLYPHSFRMRTAMATALFAGARYEEAAAQLCQVADQDPSASAPYVFMGKIQMAAPNGLACIEPRLARFAQQNPGDPVAKYFYAMAILKRRQPPADREDLEEVKALLAEAVTLNPRYGEAYLQLGMLAAARSDYGDAIREYTKAIEGNPQLADAYYRLGVAYERTSQPARAKEAFRLHDKIRQQQQEAVERERLKIKQFLFAGPARPPTSPPQ